MMIWQNVMMAAGQAGGGGGSSLYTGSYWRLLITANAGNSFTTLAEVEFRGSVGGPSLTTGGSPISSTDAYSATRVNAFDNDTSTLWYTDLSPSFIGYNFGSSVGVAEVSITARSGVTTQTPTAFTVQRSDDGTTWVDVADYTCSLGELESATFTLPTQASF